MEIKGHIHEEASPGYHPFSPGRTAHFLLPTLLFTCTEFYDSSNGCLVAFLYFCLGFLKERFYFICLFPQCPVQCLALKQTSLNVQGSPGQCDSGGWSIGL